MFTTEVFLRYYIIQVQKATSQKYNVQAKQRSMDYTYRSVFLFPKKNKKTSTPNLSYLGSSN